MSACAPSRGRCAAPKKFCNTIGVESVTLFDMTQTLALVLLAASVLPAADLPTAARFADAGQRLVPHYAAGGAWTTRVRVANPLPSVQRYRLSAYNPQGNTQTLRFNDTSAAQFEADIPAFGVSDVTLTSTEGLKTGFLSVFFLTDTRVRLPVTVFFRTTDPYNTEGAVSWDSKEDIQSQFIPYDNTSGSQTGIAVADVMPLGGSSSARVDMDCYDQFGNSIGSAPALTVGAQQASFDLGDRLNASRGNKGVCTFTLRDGSAAPQPWALTGLSLQFKGVNFLPLK